jgi:antitoxin component of MazEF toxin-antitoxin module
MPELRKLLKLTQHAYAVSLPRKYREQLKLESGDYVEVYLFDSKTIAVRKHGKVAKQ